MAGEILQMLRTFFFNRESDMDMTEGEEKEFLRATFSIMDIDENSKQSLDQLKTKFMNCKKDLGGLEVDEFEAALRPFISKGVSDGHIRTIFRKMDTSHQGAVSWEEFINFAITEHSMRLLMNETMDEMPFGSEAHCIKHLHRDPIVRIAFMPVVDVNAKTVDWNFGKYMILSREGVMSIWTLSMRSISYNNLVVDFHKDQSWFLDMACMYHNGHIATISSCRDLALYDYTVRGWIRKYHIRNLDNCACVISYWAGLKQEQAVLVLGDSHGSVVLIEFDLSNLTPLFGHSVREGCFSIFWTDILRGTCHGTTARVFKHVHNEWVKHVMYVPGLNSVLSCCMDNDTAMYMTFADPKKRTPTYFNAMKGILCFDYSHNLNVMACAGIEGSILLFNPYVPKRAVASMEAHIRPVTHLKINETEQYTISVDMSKTIIIFSLVNQSVLQRIPGQSVRTGHHYINSIYLHSERRVCLLGSKRIAYIKRHRLEDEIKVQVRSHDFKIVGALYSQEFEQVVSVCRGSTVRVWDLNTGKRVMQFTRAHEKKKQGEWVPVEIECIALSENRRRLFTAAEGIVKIWNFNTGSVLRTIEVSNCARITSILMAKRSIYITGWNRTIIVLSDFKGEEALYRTWATVHHSDCLNLCAVESNMLASSSYDGTILVWSRESTDVYCTLHPTVGPKPELSTSVRSGGNKQDIMHVAAGLDSTEQTNEDEDEDAFMTIGRHLNKESGWYRLIRAFQKRKIEIEKRKAAKEKKDFSARYKKKKKRINMQGLSLVYESAVECMVFLGSRRLIDPNTATLVSAGAECWIRFWSIHPAGGILAQFNATRRKLESIMCMVTDSQNEYLFTGDTLGFMRVFDIKEFCNADKLTQEERDARNIRLKREFVYTILPFQPEQMLDTMEKLREKKISVADASKPRTNLRAPRLLSSIRAHTMAVTSLEFIEERNVILTASHDLTVRLWTKNCTYIGTFGERWRPIPKVVGRVVERVPRIPNDILRVASAHSLATLHNGHMPHWKNACYLVRRHIHEMRKERQIEEARQKIKEEKLARGEVDDSESDAVADGEKRPVSKILGKYYKPEKKFLGPITLVDQGLPRLLMFKSSCSPYHSIVPRNLTCMDPLYKPETFFDIDSRRHGGNTNKIKRSTKIMMNNFNTVCCNNERYGGGAGARAGMSIVSAPTSVSSVTPKSLHGDRSANNPDEYSPTDKLISKHHNKYSVQSVLLTKRASTGQSKNRNPGKELSKDSLEDKSKNNPGPESGEQTPTNPSSSNPPSELAKLDSKDQVTSSNSKRGNVEVKNCYRSRYGHTGIVQDSIRSLSRRNSTGRPNTLDPSTSKDVDAKIEDTKRFYSEHKSLLNTSNGCNRKQTEIDRVKSESIESKKKNIDGECSVTVDSNHEQLVGSKVKQNLTLGDIADKKMEDVNESNKTKDNSGVSRISKSPEIKYGNIFDVRDKISTPVYDNFGDKFATPVCDHDTNEEWKALCELTPQEYFGYGTPCDDDEGDKVGLCNKYNGYGDHQESSVMKRIRNKAFDLPRISSEKTRPATKRNVRFSHLLQ